MKWGLAVGVRQDLDDVLRVSRTAYNGGIDQIWLVDFPAPQMSSIAASLLAKEIPMKLGIGLLTPLLYSPEQIARTVRTIKDTYETEPDILIGSGDPLWMSRIGLEYSSGLAAVNSVSRQISHLKKLFKKQDISSRVLLGAQGPKMIKAAQIADGVLLNYSDPKMVQWAVDLLKNQPKGFIRGVFPPTAIANKVSKMPDNVRSAAAIVALGTNSKVLEKFGIFGELKRPKKTLREMGKLTCDIVDSIPQYILNMFVLNSTPSVLSEHVSAFSSVGIDLVVFGPPLSSLQNGVELLIEAKQEYKKSQLN